ncbi:MAG: NAD(P)H-binding protein [Actinomycetota bacterium]|nr:NAD(P)H-binding protein [Actinomycetota bacterium]
MPVTTARNCAKSPEDSSAERVLVAGATGYIGHKLAVRLAEGNGPVRVMARTPSKASDLADAGCEVVEADVLKPATLAPAMKDVGVAYYLVHSMGRGAKEDFEETDRRAATNFAEAASEAGVERIIYLGGLGEGRSKHLRSRQETAEALKSTGLPLTYLRAAVVLGGGSESFRTVYYLVSRLPVMVTPRWTTTRTQPIAADDVVAYLAASKELDETNDITVELGGPDITTYGGMMDEMADAMGKRPPRRIAVPLLTPGLSSLWIGLVTPVDTGVARPLVEGLTTETVVRDPDGMERFDIEPVGLTAAMKTAVEEMEAA